MLSLYTTSVILFAAAVAVLIYIDRKNIEFKYILVMRRTERFKSIIDSIAQASPQFWKFVYSIAVVAAFGGMIYGLFSLGLVTLQVFQGDISQPPLQFILPTISSTGSSGPGYILIPCWFWVIIIAMILVPHELSHGIIARAEKIKLKSVGLLLLAIFPGAFVEPDEKQLKRAHTAAKLRVFSAGTFANFVIGAVVMLLAAYIIWPVMTDQSITITNVTAGGPAELAGVTNNSVINTINGMPITATYFDFATGRSYLQDELGESKPGDIVVLGSETREYRITLGKDESGRPFAGIFYSPNFRNLELFSLLYLLTLIWLFSFAIGVFNILPIYPLDGGLMIEAVAELFKKGSGKKIAVTITYVMILVILYNFVWPLLV